jgi:serine/threonine protein kinase
VNGWNNTADAAGGASNGGRRGVVAGDRDTAAERNNLLPAAPAPGVPMQRFEPRRVEAVVEAVNVQEVHRLETWTLAMGKPVPSANMELLAQRRDESFVTLRTQNMIGQGTFGRVFSAFAASLGSVRVVAKVSRSNHPKLHLRKESAASIQHEAEVLSYLNGCFDSGGVVPRFYAMLKPDGEAKRYEINWRAIILEQLEGPSIWKIRDDHWTEKLGRDWQSARKGGNRIGGTVHWLDALRVVASMMLPLLQELHEVGIVHCDVKTGNFVFASNNRDDLRIIDFGNSESFIVPRSSELASSRKSGVWEGEWYRERPCPVDRAWKDPDKPYEGPGRWKGPERAHSVMKAATTAYQSLRMHRAEIKQERFSFLPQDDIESVLYLMLELLKGHLPWDRESLLLGKTSGKKQEEFYKEKSYKKKVSVLESVESFAASLLPRGWMEHLEREVKDLYDLFQVINAGDNDIGAMHRKVQNTIFGLLSAVEKVLPDFDVRTQYELESAPRLFRCPHDCMNRKRGRE